MSQYEIYIFCVCVIVFVLLTALSAVMLTSVVKLMVRLIRHGAEDEKIKTEYEKGNAKKKRCSAADFCVSLVLCLILLGFFGFSLFINIRQNTYFENVPTLRVVNSASMSEKHEKNTYLKENDLNDQFDTFDLIFTYQLPAEEDLELYDIVVYEIDGELIVHRIVGIEEPNNYHPDERYFLCQGDAVDTHDRFPVRYSQMRAIYRGQRIPFVGSFVSFMQSPAGWMCVILVIVAMIATPIIYGIIEREKQKRLVEMGLLTPSPSVVQGAVAVMASVEESVAQAAGTEDAPAVGVATEEPSAPSFMSGKRDTRTFREKLADSPELTQSRYAEVFDLLCRIERVRIIEGRKHEVFKCGNERVAKFALRGKTVNAYIGLEPAEYADSKYIYRDASGIKAYAHYPMHLKLTSDRQTRWTKELILDVVKKKGLVLLENAVEPEDIPVEIKHPMPTETSADILPDITEEPIEDIVMELPADIKEQDAKPAYASHFGKRDNRTLREKLDAAPELVQTRYQTIANALLAIEGTRVIEGKKQQTFKCRNHPLARVLLRGKTLQVYLALNPADYTDTKYIYADASDKQKFKSYPMHLKITSNRQMTWACELVAELAQKRGLVTKS